MTNDKSAIADANAKAWMEQWRNAARELPRIRARELSQLTEEQGTKTAIGLAPIIPGPPRSKTGLMIWQQWMMRLAESQRVA